MGWILILSVMDHRYIILPGFLEVQCELHLMQLEMVLELVHD